VPRREGQPLGSGIVEGRAELERGDVIEPSAERREPETEPRRLCRGLRG